MPPTFGSILRALALALLCATAIGCGLGSDSSERTATGQSGDTCQKDRDVLSRLLAQPQACAVSSSCPPGSHCDPVASSCTWQCFADSDCGTGNTCTCDGQCVLGGSQPPDGGAPSADPACPRNPALLTSIRRTTCTQNSQCPSGSTCDTAAGRCTNQRTCGLDEDCPHGSRCDAATGFCELSCATSSECTGGNVCDCFGQCVAPGSAPLPVADPSRVVLRISPPMLPVTGGDWGVQTANLVLETFDAGIGTGTRAAPTLRVRAPAGLTIAGANNTPVKELVLSSWTFAASGDRYAATTAIKVARGGDFDATQENWRIEVVGDDMVDLRSTLMVGTQPPGSAAHGVFQGALVETLGNGALTRIPVTVWASDGFALIFDPSRALAPKGRLGVNRNGADSSFLWLDNATVAGAAGTLGAKAHYVAPAAPGTLDLTRGQLEVFLPLAKRRNLQFRFDVAYAGPLSAPACTASAQCGTGAYCEVNLGVCVPGDDWRLSGTVSNNLQSPSATAWVSASAWMLNSNTPGVFGRPGVPGPRGIGYSLMCFPTGPRTYAATGVFTPGFNHLGTQSVADVSGQLSGPYGLCGQPSPLALARDRKRTDATVLAAGSELLPACLAELSAAPPTAVASPAINAKNWFEAASACVSLARVHPLLDWLTPTAAVNRNRGGVEARLLHETASQWLGVLGFVLGEAVHQSPLPQVLGDDVPTVPGGTPYLAPSVASALTAAERGFDVLLRNKIVDGLNGLPRDVLRQPDYRDLRPVSYYTFDSVDDMRGSYALDIAGEAHMKLPGAFTNNTAGGINYTTEGEVSFPRGPAELFGDVLIAGKFTVPAVANGTSKTLIEYGDDTNLLYQFFYRGTASGIELWGYHGARAGSGPSTASGAVKVVSGLAGNQAISLVLRRRANYTVSEDGTATWSSEYKAFVQGQAQLSGTTTNPIPGSVTGSQAHGMVRLNGAVDEIAFWDEAVDDSLLGSIFAAGLGDNAMLGILRRKVPAGSLDNPDHSQSNGLAVTLLDTVAQYLRAAEVGMRAEVIAAHASCTPGAAPDAERDRVLTHYGRVMRYAWTLESLATSLQVRASQRGCVVSSSDPQESCPTGSTCEASAVTGESVCVTSGAPLTTAPPWQNRYDSAQSELDAARDALAGAVQPVVSCSDLMGVDSLPLFFGDVVGSSSRFFAASDYLINAWVLPAVERASASLEAARQAWLARRASEIQQLESDQDKVRRLEQIELGAAMPVMELCGLTGISALDVMDKFQSGELSLATCFRVTKPGCTGTASDTDASCYRGELGKAALAAVAAVADIRIARAEHDAAAARHQAADHYCATEQVFMKEDLDALDKHNRRMKTLSRWSAVLGGIESVAQTVASMVAPVPIPSGGSSGSAGWSNTFGSAASLAGIANGILHTGMNEIQQSFERDQYKRSQDAKIRQCQFEADQQRYGLGVLSAQIDRRLVDLQLAMLQMQTLSKRVIRELAEGKASLDREKDRKVPSLIYHYWLDEKIDRFALDLEWSRRLVYLAVRAVEYEFQQSFGLDDAVVRARGPDDLNKVVLALQRERAARTINGRRPEETSVVLSLRDDVLHVSDRTTPQKDASGNPRLVGERNWSATRRFGEELRSPKFAVYDDRGDYLGQGIPFSMKEQGALAYRCAERLWRVNATVQGDVIDTKTPSVPVILFKRNTFTSQWCDGKGDGGRYQLGNLRPSAELFRNGGSGGEGDDQGYSSALMYPWFNVVRSEFFRDQYTEGSSEELAGRGLYGDYILLFPESGLLEWTDGDPSNDFALHRVEDVLIRLDLLSVDDISLH